MFKNYDKLTLTESKVTKVYFSNISKKQKKYDAAYMHNCYIHHMYNIGHIAHVKILCICTKNIK